MARKGDTRLLVGATLAVVVAGLVVAAAILLLTGRSGTPKLKKPTTFGVAKQVRANIEEGGPLLYAGTSGDTGFWIALEDGRLVAIVVQQPALGCHVKWQATRDSFTCKGRKVRSTQLQRYQVTVPERGEQKGDFLVDLRRVQPAPNP